MIRIIMLTLVTIILLMDNLSACATCFGAPDAPMTKGMNMAILTLLGVTGSVMGMAGTMFIVLRRRARMLREKLNDNSIKESED
ncbi:MAG TPA: hypothetical protein EYM55_00300 [Candidatus Marinimicrobia bacterium]|nr:hypothetical protein [Candidatus Neomarinimicrobiota bacterium]HIC51224.1 hypothetical protein [Candidatus Neomarinimicrobiota bacterium]HIM83049.1 hypothetical protein [Candidatus Neomarinimicrobiota bacterium]